MTSSWFFLSTLNYDARSTTHHSSIRVGTVLSGTKRYRLMMCRIYFRLVIFKGRILITLSLLSSNTILPVLASERCCRLVLCWKTDETLMKMNGMSHKADCIVLVLAALQHKEKFCLIFQECTNVTWRYLIYGHGWLVNTNNSQKRILFLYLCKHFERHLPIWIPAETGSSELV